VIGANIGRFHSRSDLRSRRARRAKIDHPRGVGKSMLIFLAQQRRCSVAKDFLNFDQPMDLLSGLAGLDQWKEAVGCRVGCVEWLRIPRC